MEGLFEEAALIFARLRSQTDPAEVAYAIATVRLAHVREHQQQFDPAWRILEELISHPEAETLYHPHYWWAQYHRGVMLHRLGRLAEAQDVLERVRQTVTEKDLRLAAWHHLGIIAIDQRRLVEAEARFQQCLSERGDNPWNYRRAYEYRRLGQVYALTERFAEAQAAFLEALSISRACGNQRYIHHVQRDMARFLVAPQLLRERPPFVSLPQLAQQFGVEPTYLREAFYLLYAARDGYLDVVEADTARPTGQIVRWDVAHAEGWWHTAVVVIVLDSQGQIAWQQRGETESRGKWDVSVAGHVMVGEDDLSAAMRETAEELGLQVSPERLTRMGKPGEFRKMGAPVVVTDGYGDLTTYAYRTNKRNYERFSLFVVTIAEAEKAHIVVGDTSAALAIAWHSLFESAQAARERPEQFASAFKQIFGHAATVQRLQSIISPI